jgi:lipopolysaccharide/colanic/teichoic acid biosynthesis glycosyltransferase
MMPAWGSGFHGAIRRSDLEALGARSIRDVALGRRATGAGPLMTLTALPGGADRRSLPAGATGQRHTGANGTPLAIVDEVPAEPLDRYIERRLDEAPFVFLPNRSRAYAFVKRAMDLLGAIVLLAVSWPLIIALAVAIRLDSPGPALFRQDRVTRGGRVFRFYKFRTMYVDARDRFPELYAYQNGDGGRGDVFYKLADDPRNTRFGRWLRRTTLDELPNLFNVIRGELAIVGPRPTVQVQVDRYTERQRRRLEVKPGITGWAQVNGRASLPWPERIELDVWYVDHRSLRLDLRILAMTARMLLSGRGLYSADPTHGWGPPP